MRRIQNLMEQWLFIGPDNRQEQVNLPHTWNAKDGQDGGNDYYRGTMRKHLKNRNLIRRQRKYIWSFLV
mgnify:CR=1 FL=1